MGRIKYFLISIVLAVNFAEAKQPAEFDNLSDLSNSLPHVTSFDSLLFDLGNRFDRLEYRDLSDDFVAEYLYPIQNMVRYSFNTGLLLNKCRVYTVYRNNKGSFLIYSLVGPEGYTIYLADITDIQTTQFPPSLALFRFYKGQTFIWSTYNKSSNRLIVHNQSHCYNCEYENGEKYLVEQTQSYFLEKGLPYTPRFDKCYTYSVPENYIHHEPVPNIKEQCSSSDSVSMENYLDRGMGIFDDQFGRLISTSEYDKPPQDISELYKLYNYFSYLKNESDYNTPYILLTSEFVTSFLYPIKNMAYYNFDSGLLENNFKALKIDSIGNNEYLFYALYDNKGYTTYMAYSKDLKQDRYPVTLAIKRYTTSGSIIWSSYNCEDNTITIFNRSAGYKTYNGQRIIIEQAQIYSLIDGIKPLPYNDNYTVYLIPDEVRDIEPIPDKKLHSFSHKTESLIKCIQNTDSIFSIENLNPTNRINETN